MCFCFWHLFQVNFIDTYHRSGLYPRASFPAGLGEEGAGTVAEVGPGKVEISMQRRFKYGIRLAALHYYVQVVLCKCGPVQLPGISFACSPCNNA
jgi:NADPH:quinone reductase-like Zn-dependent oxidoreductase